MNKTYILRDYGHIGMTLILIRPGDLSRDQGLTKGTWETLGKIERVSDLHPVFIGRQSGIDQRKFTELYQGSSYITTDSEVEGILGSIKYDQAIYPGAHIVYPVLEISEIKADTSGVLRKVLEEQEVLKKSMFKVKRLGPEELLSKYVKDKGAWWKPVDRKNTYSSHTVTSDLIVLKPGLARELMETSPEYQETFESFRDFLGSTVGRRRDAGRPVLLNLDPKDVEVNTVRV